MCTNGRGSWSGRATLGSLHGPTRGPCPSPWRLSALGGAQFLAELLGLDQDSKIVSGALSLGLLAVATWGNTHGRHILKAIVRLCILAEIVGSIGVGVLLSSFHRLHPPSILTDEPELSRIRSLWQAFFR